MIIREMLPAKAISVLENMAIDMTGSLAGLEKANPMAEVLEQRLDAINAAQAALQEKIDRESQDNDTNSGTQS